MPWYMYNILPKKKKNYRKHYNIIHVLHGQLISNSNVRIAIFFTFFLQLLTWLVVIKVTTHSPRSINGIIIIFFFSISNNRLYQHLWRMLYLKEYTGQFKSGLDSTQHPTWHNLVGDGRNHHQLNRNDDSIVYVSTIGGQIWWKPAKDDSSCSSNNDIMVRS